MKGQKTYGKITRAFFTVSLEKWDNMVDTLKKAIDAGKLSNDNLFGGVWLL